MSQSPQRKKREPTVEFGEIRAGEINHTCNISAKAALTTYMQCRSLQSPGSVSKVTNLLRVPIITRFVLHVCMLSAEGSVTGSDVRSK